MFREVTSLMRNSWFFAKISVIYVSLQISMKIFLSSLEKIGAIKNFSPLLVPIQSFRKKFFIEYISITMGHATPLLIILHEEASLSEYRKTRESSFLFYHLGYVYFPRSITDIFIKKKSTILLLILSLIRTDWDF